MSRRRSAGDHRAGERGGAHSGALREQRDGGGVRGGARSGTWHQHREQQAIAQAAARLIVDHGITDWVAAKRKAARALMLPDGTPLPPNEVIEAALAEHHALFGGDTHAEGLRRQRKLALAWMRRLEVYSPVLIGGVAAGWATAHSDTWLELVADDPKVVEMKLLGAGVRYTAITPAAEERGAPPQLRLDLPEGTIRLVVLAPGQRHSRSRQDPEQRLPVAALEALLGVR